MRWLATLLTLVLAFQESAPAAEPEGRLRLMIETDAGGDPDDEQSLVRFLLYSNEWDVEGIIANREAARDGENLNPVRTGLGIVRRFIDAYAECHPSLEKNDPRYPPPDRLRAVTVPGYGKGGEGVKLVREAVDRADQRPLWFLNWGTDNGSAPSSLKLALDAVLRERGREGYEKWKSRLRLSSDDQFGGHTFVEAPPFALWVDTFRPPVDGKRWYHRFSALTATAGGFDVERHVRAGHGPLGALYPTNTTHPQKEGDTMSFLYLVPNGLDEPDEPGWGGWAGRYGPREGAAGRPYYWASGVDAFEGATHRDNTLRRWAAHLQNDFRARLDWCVKPYAKANHPPRPVVNGSAGLAALRVEAAAGSELKLDATGSSDPDGGELGFEWLIYAEAGTYRGRAALEGAQGPRAVLRVPADLGRGEIHVVLVVTDRGDPPLTRYRRLVVRGAAPSR
jgi:Protein of unknown function (DUF1593)